MILGLVRAGLLLLVGLASPGLARADDGAGALREAAVRLLADGVADDAVKAGALLDDASQIEARSADLAKAQAAHAVLEEEIVNALAPLVTTLVLVGTLIFNISTARTAERDKRKDDEAKALREAEERKRQALIDQDKAFYDALDRMMASDKFSPAVAVIRPFLEGAYKDRARAAVLSLMRATESMDTFRDMFRLIYAPGGEENLDEMLGMLRDCHRKVEDFWWRAWDEVKQVTDETRLPQQMRDEAEFEHDKRKFLSGEVAAVLRRPADGPRPALVLDELGFELCNLSGANLAGASVRASVWREVMLDGCDLRGVKGFEDFWLWGSAWWRADYIDEAFLALLETKFGYDTPGVSWVANAVVKERYAAEVARLRASQPAQPRAARSPVVFEPIADAEAGGEAVVKQAV